jgi:MFS family permease
VAADLVGFRHLEGLPRDAWLLFATRFVRLFAYGALAVVLLLYLTERGLSAGTAGALLTAALLGDTAVSLWITTTADRIGRRRMLLLGAGLMLLAGLVFAATRNVVLLMLAAAVGVISPSGGEVGPFLAIEQAALSQLAPASERTRVFAWYNLTGSIAAALGSLAAGQVCRVLQARGMSALAGYQAVVAGYAGIGVLLGVMFLRAGRDIEVPRPSAGSPARNLLGLHRSRGVVLRLAGLFSLDAFAGGLILQAIVAYWFHVRFRADPATIGAVFFGANILAGISALTASRLAARFGLINTMVFTHIPSNLLLMLVPLMPTLSLAIAVLLLRFSISQMDVPTRQSYTMSVVDPDERSAAAGVTGVARSTGAALSPTIAGRLMASQALLSVPFFVSGGLKIAYDLLLYRSFRKTGPR